MKKILWSLALMAMLTSMAFAQDNKKTDEQSQPSAEKKADEYEVPEQFTVYFMGILTRGAKWTPEETPEIQQLQKDHLAHIGEMAKAGKLVLAGPFLDNGQMRGIFIFKVSSLAEAKALAEADPAVKAGRLVVELHPWMVQKGILP